MRALLGILFLFPLVFLPLASDAAAKCTCRNRDGSRHEMGALACLNVDGRQYLARCEMALNVPNWKKLQDGCPVTQGPSDKAAPAAM